MTGADIAKISADLQALLAEFRDALKAANVGQLSEDARELLDGLEKSNTQLRAVLKNLEPATRISGPQIRALVDNLTTASANLRSVQCRGETQAIVIALGNSSRTKAYANSAKRGASYVSRGGHRRASFEPERQAGREGQARCLVERLLPFSLRDGVGHDSRSRVKEGVTTFEDRRSYRDRELAFAVIAKIADRARVDAAGVRFEFGNDFERALLRSTRNGTAGEASAQRCDDG